MAKGGNTVGVTERGERRKQALAVNLLGVEKRSVHVEKDGLDAPAVFHLAAALAACSAILRKHSRHRQSSPSTGIGRRMISSLHQQSPSGLHENSVPQREQARRRSDEHPFRFVMMVRED
jgi:hypothetical protein